MQPNAIVAPEEWAAARRALPWVRVDKAYVFDTPEGPATLAELFGRHEQLIVWHFMFGRDWEEGCTSCSFWADHYSPAVVHLDHRGVGLVAVSTAPLERLEAYRRRMGWSFRWVSAGDNGFNRDFAVTFAPEEVASGAPLYNFATLPVGAQELPGLSVFALGDDGTVYRTYSTYARGIDPLNATYQQLDLVPKGRDEAALPRPMAWLRRHDRYAD